MEAGDGIHSPPPILGTISEHQTQYDCEDALSKNSDGVIMDEQLVNKDQVVSHYTMWGSMPVIKSNGKCSYCDSADDCLLTCCSCSTAYHGACLLNKRGWRNEFGSDYPNLPGIVDLRALIQAQKLRNFGSIAWLCEPCQVRKELCNRDLYEERISRLEANLLLENKNNGMIMDKLESIDGKINNSIYKALSHLLPNVLNAVSSNNANALNSFDNVNNVNAFNDFDSTSNANATFSSSTRGHFFGGGDTNIGTGPVLGQQSVCATTGANEGKQSFASVLSSTSAQKSNNLSSQVNNNNDNFSLQDNRSKHTSLQGKKEKRKRQRIRIKKPHGSSTLVLPLLQENALKKKLTSLRMVGSKVLPNGSTDVFIPIEDDIDIVTRDLEGVLPDGFVVEDSAKQKSVLIDLVGLNAVADSADVLSSIVQRNDCLGLSDASEQSIKEKIEIVKIVSCRKNSDNFRVVMKTTQEMAERISKTQRNTQYLYVGSTRCIAYVHSPHFRCYNCQLHGHRAQECKNDVACAKCAGNHDTKQCESTIVKCINCKREGKEDAHRADSSDCPVYMAARAKK